MSKLDFISQKPIIDENLQFGLTTLHAWIRFLETILNISYKLDLKKPTKRGATNKQMEDRKSRVQNELRKEFGVFIDKVVSGKKICTYHLMNNFQ